MPIELKITVNHATDLAAEVANLASIFGVTGETPAAPSKSAPTAPVTLAKAETPAKTETAPAASGTASEGKKTLDRKAQDAAVAEMIAAGAKDDRFDMLTKGRQNEVEAALAKKAEPETKSEEADLDEMFGDDAPAKTVTRDEVSALMGKIGKDKDGNPIQPRLLKIREILVDLIPEGQEIKVKNLPEDKLAEAYEKISKVEG